MIKTHDLLLDCLVHRPWAICTDGLNPTLQTIAVIPVEPQGVLQFGSNQKVSIMDAFEITYNQGF